MKQQTQLAKQPAAGQPGVSSVSVLSSMSEYQYNIHMHAIKQVQAHMHSLSLSYTHTTNSTPSPHTHHAQVHRCLAAEIIIDYSAAILLLASFLWTSLFNLSNAFFVLGCPHTQMVTIIQVHLTVIMFTIIITVVFIICSKRVSWNTSIIFENRFRLKWHALESVSQPLSNSLLFLGELSCKGLYTASLLENLIRAGQNHMIKFDIAPLITWAHNQHRNA